MRAKLLRIIRFFGTDDCPGASCPHCGAEGRYIIRFVTDAMIVVNVYDDLGWDDAGRIRISLEVRQAGKVIFPRGQLYGALFSTTSDAIRAREHALAILEMKPGDTDVDYFADYTPEQLAWARRYGEEISCIRQARYCDERGEVRR